MRSMDQRMVSMGSARWPEGLFLHPGKGLDLPSPSGDSKVLYLDAPHISADPTEDDYLAETRTATEAQCSYR